MKPKITADFVLFIRAFAALAAAVSLLAAIQTQVQTQALLKLNTRYKWALLILIFGANLVVGVYVALKPQRAAGWLRRIEPRRLQGPLGFLSGVALLLVPVPAFLFARGDFFGSGNEAFFRLLWLFGWLALAQAVGLRFATGLGWLQAFASVVLLDGLAAQLFSLSVAVSSYPFSMGWSEASRYYYGSLVFSEAVYGERLPLSVMHGSRYLLQSLPFLLSNSPLVYSRLWQVFLWIGLTLGASWSIARRVRVHGRLDYILLLGWLFLYMFQGAVYYHLQICVIIVMVGISMQHPRRSLLAVAAASFWAGLSRVNWIPVPAMLAIGIYLLEGALRPDRNMWRYLGTPVLWAVVGILSALTGQGVYIAVSGNSNLQAFASSFTSALLWYRWWPSATNPIGIVPGVVIVTLPLAVLLGWRMQTDLPRMHWLRVWGLGGMLILLLAVGLVVSTKIGGGGDLHNMDAYLVMLALLGAYAARGPLVGDDPRAHALRSSPASIFILMVYVPVAFSLQRLTNPFSYDVPRAAGELATLRQEIGEYKRSGKVLFIYERHLRTFGLVPAIPVVKDYEVVTLMEMAISKNDAYLRQFYSDLEHHRFSAIVAHPQNLGVESQDFIEENDAWNRFVARPLLCQYKPALTLGYSGVQLLVPRARPCQDWPPALEE